MYSKQEASRLRHQFWTTFGQYMNPIVSAEGEKINWLNYKTGEKNILFRMHADNQRATIAIELHHRDKDIQQLYFEQFLQFQTLFRKVVREEWEWHLYSQDDNGKPISSISKDKEGVSIFQKQDWPELISFFKPRIIALDEFWSQARYAFEGLR